MLVDARRPGFRNGCDRVSVSSPRPMAPFELAPQQTDDPKVLQVALAGELDLTNARELEERIAELATGDVATVVLDLVLIPHLGIIGAAIGSYTAMLSGNVWLYFLVKKRLGVSAVVSPFHLRRRREATAT